MTLGVQMLARFARPLSPHLWAARVLGLLTLMLNAALAAPAQSPLLNRAAKPPAPNVMITLDDSGSMQAHYIPEGVSTVNGFAVTFPSQYTHPNERYFMDIAINDPSHHAYLDAAGPGPAVVQAVKGDPNVFQRQMRSAGVNRIYYDPSVRYLPWYRPDGTRYANASPSAARWDPLLSDPSNTVDLTADLVELFWGGNAPTQLWCSAHDLCEVSRRAWYPGLYYVLKPGANPHFAASYDEYDINDPIRHSPATKDPARTDCAASFCTQAEERQNFANWFQFYRSRMLLTKAAISEVIGGAKPATAPRFGFASINTGSQMVDGLKTSVVRTGVREDSPAHRSRLLSDIQSTVALAGTPLKNALLQVGRYFTLEADNDAALGARSTGSPWRTDPTPSSSAAYSEMLACRRAYNILMTDGYDNGDPEVSVGNRDGSDGAVQALDPDLRARVPHLVDRYLAQRPFSDGYSNTLADYASYFYVRDLAPSIPNKVSPLSGDWADPHSWQHLGQFTVGLGVSGQLPAGTAAERQHTRTLLSSGLLAWPDPGVGGDGGLAAKIDDVFHVAVNTGGDFFRASNAKELTGALRQAMGRVSAAARTDAGVTGGGSIAQPGLLKFEASYQSGLWVGDLKAYDMVADGQGGGVFKAGTNPRWKASEVRPSWEARTMLTWDAASGAAVPFDTGMSSALKERIAGTRQTDAVINYLRGDPSHEGQSSDSFRARDGKLPDFVNAPPVYVKNLVNLGYSWEGYDMHVLRKASREGMVYLGGGGGFLHGFEASTGIEKFAYMPKGVQRKASALADQGYGADDKPHEYFVDGPMLESDALVGGEWRNVLIGTLGAGGRGVYALDVTHPAALAAPATAAPKVLWDFSEEDDPDLGFVTTAPELGRVKGKWYAFFGNGTHSAAGRAVLFAVDMETRQLHKLVVDRQGENGLSAVRALRRPDRELMAIYGVDLRGQVWRVDFDDKSEVSDWRIGFGGVPLFQAKDRSGRPQPITAKPALATHFKGGQVLVFGTGKLLEEGDLSSSDMQSLYGVWDRTDGLPSATEAPWAALDNQRVAFLEQVLTTASVDIVQADGSTRRFYQSSSNKMNWETHRGWFMDLSLPGGAAGTGSGGGQRVIHPVEMVDEFALFSTVTPGADPLPCESSSGKGHHFVLLAVSGEVYERPVLDINGDGLVDKADRWDANGDGVLDDKDGWAGGYETGAAGVGFITRAGGQGWEGAPGGSFHTAQQAMNWRTYCVNLNCKISDRVWKQIVSPPQPK
ncbi:MAG: hypothetical protein C4K60_07620 [Ideonella sp. MAG2]|nr:MAG: hypothetical protein C4K60_07620 [Ideonella sp. MAG2]